MAKSVEPRIGEALIAIVLLTIGLLAILFAWDLPLGTMALPGPRIFPSAIGFAISVVATLGLIRAIRTPQSAERIVLGNRDAVLTLAMLCFSAFAFEWIGAVATFAIFLTVLLMALAKLAWWQASVASLISAIVAWVVFTIVLGVRLPGAPY